MALFALFCNTRVYPRWEGESCDDWSCCPSCWRSWPCRPQRGRCCWRAAPNPTTLELLSATPERSVIELQAQPLRPGGRGHRRRFLGGSDARGARPAHGAGPAGPAHPARVAGHPRRRRDGPARARRRVHRAGRRGRGALQGPHPAQHRPGFGGLRLRRLLPGGRLVPAGERSPGDALHPARHARPRRGAESLPVQPGHPHPARGHAAHGGGEPGRCRRGQRAHSAAHGARGGVRAGLRAALPELHGAERALREHRRGGLDAGDLLRRLRERGAALRGLEEPARHSDHAGQRERGGFDGSADQGLHPEPVQHE